MGDLSQHFSKTELACRDCGALVLDPRLVPALEQLRAAAGAVVIVSVTTRRERSEDLVVLNSGDHPFIQHESVVAYRYSEIREIASIEAALRDGQALRRERVSQQLLDRIRAGLRDSDFTPNGVREYFLETESAIQ